MLRKLHGRINRNILFWPESELFTGVCRGYETSNRNKMTNRVQVGKIEIRKKERM